MFPALSIARIFAKLTFTPNRSISPLKIAFLLLFSARFACAQTIWTGGPGDWFKIGNWSGGVPSLSTDAEINNDGTARVDSGVATAGNLYLGFDRLDSGNLSISGLGVLNNDSFLAVGNFGRGMVTVENGGTLSDAFGNIGNLAGSDGTVLIEGTDSNWRTDLYLNVGYSGTGTLTIRGGGVVSDRLGFVGWNTGSSGVVSVDGVGSTWKSIGQIQIGSEGTGELTIRNGGAVLDLVGYIGDTGDGTAFLDGAGSVWSSEAWLVVGNGGRGALTIQNAATVSSPYGFIGRLTGSKGTVIVDGADSIWTSSVSLEVGEFGTGSLTIQNAGAVFSGRGSLGSLTDSSGDVIVDGPGSRWSNTQSLEVGHGTLAVQNGGAVASDSGFINGGTALIDGVGSFWTTGQFNVGSSFNGSLAIRNGGALSSSLAYIGGYSGGSGVVLVDGAGSTWTNDGVNVQLNVGFLNAGTLNIFHGGVVSSFTAGVGVGARSSGNVAVDGASSAWSIRTNLYVGGGNIGRGGEPGGIGRLQIRNGGEIRSMTTTIFGRGMIVDNALLMSQEVSIKAGGLLTGGGRVAGNVVSAGQVEPGDPIGSLTIAGNYTQLSNGTLTLAVAGIDADDSDHFDTTGSATIDGTLEVRFVNGFLPVSGQVFKLLNVAGAFTGSFAQTIFPDLRDGFQFQAEFVNRCYQITALNDGVAAVGLLNISTRARVGSGDNALIGGFIVTGKASSKMIIRAIGPSLAVDGTPLPGRLADPTLELRDSAGDLIFSNDNWVDSPQRQEIRDSTIPPNDDREAAIVATLAPGSYTATMRGVSNTAGIGVVEVYDLAQQVSATLSNISTRGFVETGDNVMIGGFIVGNQASRLLVRAIGPSLTQSGISNALPDPTLELYNRNGDVIAFNNDWRETDEAIIENTGIPPTNDRESAIVATLAPGNYTAVVRGRNETTGVGLVEVYNVP